jgi:isopropylmalate/homocitrate/citramalate synthase
MTSTMPMPRNDIDLIEVSPRDGLQNEKIPLTVAQRIDLITQLANAGAKRIEAVAFVHPTRVPQMANAEEVMAGLPRDNGASYSGLILNRKGLDRALESKVDEVHLVIPGTDEMSLANQNVTVAEMLILAKEVSDVCQQESIPLTMTVAVAFGCPFAGEVSTEQVARVLDGMTKDGVDIVFAGHTHGGQVRLPWFGGSRSLTTNCDLPNWRSRGLTRIAGEPWLNVSAGMGYSPFAPFRIFCPSEVSLLILCEKSP